MQLFYSPDITPNVAEFIFSKEESRHMIRVLRKEEGDILHITDGKGRLYEVEIVVASNNKCIVQLLEVKLKAPPKYHLHIAIAPTKLNDRFEWFLEKATEIGIQEISPIICDHSERKVLKEERLHKIIQSAMKQSQQTYLPKLNPLTTFSSFLNSYENNAAKYIAHCYNNEKITLKNDVDLNQSYLILIGPEGDFSQQEIKKSLNTGFKPITLGNSRLRTETAAIVSCQNIAFIHQ